MSCPCAECGEETFVHYPIRASEFICGDCKDRERMKRNESDAFEKLDQCISEYVDT